MKRKRTRGDRLFGRGKENSGSHPIVARNREKNLGKKGGGEYESNKFR